MVLISNALCCKIIILDLWGITEMARENVNRTAFEPAVRSTRILATDALLLQLAFFQGCYLYIGLLERLSRKSSLTLSQFCTLWLLNAVEQPLLASEIVHYVPVEQSAVSLLIDKLYEMGLVTRRRSRRDRRIVEISITKKGDEKFLEASPAVFNVMQQIFHTTSKSDHQKKLSSIRAIRNKIIEFSGKNTYPYEVYYREHIKIKKDAATKKKNNNSRRGILRKK